MADLISCLHDGSTKLRSVEDLYASPPPWDIGRPQPAFLALAKAGEIHGRVLDAGCGTGEHALMAARLGLDATGIDLASTALCTAMRKARHRGLAARFVLWDARLLADLTVSFGTVLDCGLFHIFGDHDRGLHVKGLRSVLRPGGRYFHVRLQQPTARRARAAPADARRHHQRVHRRVADRLHRASHHRHHRQPHGIRAWLAAFTRT